VRAAGILVAIALALALQTTLTRFLVGGSAAIDLVLVVVVYVALTTGPGIGMLAGSGAGLIQDALSSSGILGIGGLAKSIVGFMAGVIGQQFIVTAALPRFVMFMTATVVHSVVFRGLYFVLGLPSFPSSYAAVLSQAVGNAAVGMIGFTLIEALPGMIERRRVRRR
jgi:rod shape-determining protein MreD